MLNSQNTFFANTLKNYCTELLEKKVLAQYTAALTFYKLYLQPFIIAPS